MHIWGCRVLAPGHNLKKSEDRALDGKLYGVSKTRSILRWLNIANDNVKYAHCARFLEIDILHPSPPPIGQQLLALDPASKTCDLECPVLTIGLGDRAHFDTEPMQVTVNLPPIGSPLEIKMSFDDSYHLPFLVSTTSDGVLAQIPSTQF
jgi:hypothetical protein